MEREQKELDTGNIEQYTSLEEKKLEKTLKYPETHTTKHKIWI